MPILIFCIAAIAVWAVRGLVELKAAEQLHNLFAATCSCVKRAKIPAKIQSLLTYLNVKAFNSMNSHHYNEEVSQI